MTAIEAYLKQIEYKVAGTLWHDIHKLLNKICQPTPFCHEDEPRAVQIAKKQLNLVLLRSEARTLLARMGTGWKDEIEQQTTIHGKEFERKKKSFFRR